MEAELDKPTVEKQKCEVCDANPFKYTCPKCEVKTCCLDCVRIHKKELSCDGQRDCTAFVPMSKFNNLNLLSDYRFLEDIDRAVTNSRRNPLKHSTRIQRLLPPKLWNLKKEASKRKTDLLFLPQHFTRHKNNQSYCVRGTKEIHWKLDLIFPQADMIKISEVVSEKTKLANILDKYFDPVKCPQLYKQHLRFYQAAGLSDVDVLLKAEQCKAPKSVHLLDLSSSMEENLCKKVIIEYPTMYIIRKAYKDEYVILGDDNEIPKQESNKKSGYFGDFTPLSFFDTLDKKKDCKKENDDKNMAYNTIVNCAQQLRQDDYQ